MYSQNYYQQQWRTMVYRSANMTRLANLPVDGVQCPLRIFCSFRRGSCVLWDTASPHQPRHSFYPLNPEIRRPFSFKCERIWHNNQISTTGLPWISCLLVLVILKKPSTYSGSFTGLKNEIKIKYYCGQSCFRCIQACYTNRLLLDYATIKTVINDPSKASTQVIKILLLTMLNVR